LVIVHRIATIHFPPGCEDGPMTCSCGAAMLGSEFGAHRRDHAHGRRLRFALKVPEGYDQTPGWMRESRRRRGERQAAGLHA
jgi:hypothetical protein